MVVIVDLQLTSSGNRRSDGTFTKYVPTLNLAHSSEANHLSSFSITFKMNVCTQEIGRRLRRKREFLLLTLCTGDIQNYQSVSHATNGSKVRIVALG